MRINFIPQSIQDFKSSIVAIEGIANAPMLDDGAPATASTIYCWSVSLAYPYFALEAPSPSPWPTSIKGILHEDRYAARVYVCLDEKEKLLR